MASQAQNQSLDKWDEYPSNLDNCGYLKLYEDPRAKRLRELDKKIFQDKKVIVRVIDGFGQTPCVDALDAEDKVVTRLQTSVEPGVRIVSVSQDFSLDPLSTTRRCMCKILSLLKVSPCFLDVLLKFGFQPIAYEEGSGIAALVEPTEKSIDISYQFTYVEKKIASDPWPVRQIGIFHRYEYGLKHNTCLLLSSTDTKSSIAQQRLESIAVDRQKLPTLIEHPLNLHLIILSVYLPNWQVFLESMNAEYLEIKGRIPSRIESPRDYGINPDTLGPLYLLENTLSSKAAVNIRKNIMIVEKLSIMNERLCKAKAVNDFQYRQLQDTLDQFLGRLKSHLDSTEILKQRIDASINLLGSLLELKNQQLANKMNDQMREENTTINLITRIGMLYLPSSWVASFFGSNFFYMNSGGFQWSHLVWVYFVIAIPLTILTALWAKRRSSGGQWLTALAKNV